MSAIPTPMPSVPGSPIDNPGKALSVRSTAHSVATTTPAPDLSAVDELLSTMKETLGTLGATFDTLGEQTARIATLGPAMDSAHQVHRLRKQLQNQDRRHEERIGEIKVLLRDVLKDQIIAHLSTHVHEMIREGVAKIVQEHVQRQLLEQIPMHLKEQVHEHKRQIEQVKRSLYNSEARRANALLRSNHLSEPLHPLLRPNGEHSDIFPKDLATLFGQNSSSARQLATEFELPVAEGEPSSRERNLNRFMQHIGVAFLMVPHDRKAPLVTNHGLCLLQPETYNTRLSCTFIFIYRGRLGQQARSDALTVMSPLQVSLFRAAVASDGEKREGGGVTRRQSELPSDIVMFTNP